jgi:hypothetical protein
MATSPRIQIIRRIGAIKDARKLIGDVDNFAAEVGTDGGPGWQRPGRLHGETADIESFNPRLREWHNPCLPRT